MNIWNNIKNLNKSYKTLRYILIFITLTGLQKMNFIAFWISKISVELGYFYLAILFYIWCIFAATIFSAFLNYIFEKMDERIYKKEKKYKKSLFIWLGEDSISGDSVYKLFNSDANKDYNVIENLNSISNILKEKTDDNLTNYNLLKNHLEFKQKNSSKKKLNNALLASLLGTIFTTGITSIIKKKIDYDISIKQIKWDYIVEFFSHIENYSLLFYFCGFVYMLYIFTLTFYSKLTESSRRINYLISILDVLIKDKESSKEN